MFQSMKKELEFACHLLLDNGRNPSEYRAGRLMYERFRGEPLKVQLKADGSKVTDLDLLLSEWIVGAYRTRGIRVVSEEGGTAPYGSKNVIVLDPADGTNDLIAGQKRSPRVSLAMISIGILTTRLEAGAVIAPLLGSLPVLYGGGRDIHAFRQIGGVQREIRVNPKPTRGIVLMSAKTTEKNQVLRERLIKAGLTPFGPREISGAVFKACAFFDPLLLSLYQQPQLVVPDLPIVGYITSGYLHDIAGTVPIARAAGAIVSSCQGNDVGLGRERGCVMANNRITHQLLLNSIKG